MTENELRSIAVKTAANWIGKREDDGSFKEILDVYNRIKPLPRGYRMTERDPWCAAFVSAVGAAAGLSDIIMPECSCDYMAAAYVSRGAYKSRSFKAQPGDLIFYNWDGNASLDHVGIVEELIAGGYRIIEGNKSDAVGRRSVPDDWRLIAGIAVPDYAGKAGEHTLPASKPEEEPTKQEQTVGFPNVARGTYRSIRVMAMQSVLITRGFGCGPDGADGDFGANTERAVRAFQEHYGLNVTGICDAATWQKLLGFT